jgi:hypothetical protein
MFERFTDRARKVMQLANQEAQRFNHEYIGTEHILLGLAKEGSGVAAHVLKNMDIDLQKIRMEVDKIVQHGPGSEQVVTGRLPHTPRAKKVIDYSAEQARNLIHSYVGTEHLLLGLLREQEGIAAQVLMNLGLKLDDVREEVLNLLGHNIPDSLVTEEGDPSSTFGAQVETFIRSMMERGTTGPKPPKPDEVKPIPPSEPHPPSNDPRVCELDEEIEALNRKRDEAVMEHDFNRAAGLREEVHRLLRQREMYSVSEFTPEDEGNWLSQGQEPKQSDEETREDDLARPDRMTEPEIALLEELIIRLQTEAHTLSKLLAWYKKSQKPD